MLEASWENHATELANAHTAEDFVEIYKKLQHDLKIKPDAASNVVYARDTRASGPALVRSLTDSFQA